MTVVLFWEWRCCYGGGRLFWRDSSLHYVRSEWHTLRHPEPWVYEGWRISSITLLGKILPACRQGREVSSRTLEAKIPSLRGLSEAFQHNFLPVSEDTLFEEALAGGLARFFSFAENKLPRAQELKSRWDFKLRFLRKGCRAQLRVLYKWNQLLFLFL